MRRYLACARGLSLGRACGRAQAPAQLRCKATRWLSDCYIELPPPLSGISLLSPPPPPGAPGPLFPAPPASFTLPSSQSSRAWIGRPIILRKVVGE